MPSCLICANNSPSLRFKLKYDIYHCKKCGLQFCIDASFSNNFKSDLNEDFREKALKQLRKQNFQLVISSLKRHLNINPSGLEVGSGHGWFLEDCKENGIKCEGIEPETRFNDYYQSKGLKVINGFYPHDIPKSRKFDFIGYNDVLEHIPAVNQIIEYNNIHLNDNGLLVISIPVQEGLVYRFATIAYYFGVKSLMNRMWQFNFHSPHLYYFTKKNLIPLLSTNGFQLIEICKLKTINISEISNRIKQDKNVGFIQYFATLLGVIIVYPFLHFFPDSVCFVFKKREDILDKKDT